VRSQLEQIENTDTLTPRWYRCSNTSHPHDGSTHNGTSLTVLERLSFQN